MQTTSQHIQIRDLQITPPVLLAPMAGLTHSALRQVISGFGGVGLLSTEMLAARRLPTESSTVSPWLIKTALEKPLSYQLLFSTVEELAPAIEALHKLRPDAIDLNMGCPAATVGRFGAGVMLMDQPDEVRRMVAEARKRTQLPLSAKIRLMSDQDEQKLKDFCAMLQDEGIDLLTVHARLKNESFSRRPRWESLAKVKDWLKIPVIANGGIFSVQDAAQCLRVSKADGLMLGRGAAIRPWLFSEIAREVYGCTCAETSVSLPVIYSDFFGFLQELFRPEYRLGRLKEFTRYFAQNYQFGHYLSSRIQSCNSMEEAEERAKLFFETNT